jgi:hypothetical protein
MTPIAIVTLGMFSAVGGEVVIRGGSSGLLIDDGLKKPILRVTSIKEEIIQEKVKSNMLVIKGVK